ncbi:unnamed protein product [Phytomonas sp. Hart1]|nr:unnamed protein product [Phytomonas sp. Hart1]|eukprot:CCW67362.1 unnamed protein product [Phytomonas sp. isolate Hart1]
MRQTHFLIFYFVGTGTFTHSNLLPNFFRKQPTPRVATLEGNDSNYFYSVKCKANHDTNSHWEGGVKGTRCAVRLEANPAEYSSLFEFAPLRLFSFPSVQFSNSGARKRMSNFLCRNITISTNSAAIFTTHRWQSVNNEPCGEADASPMDASSNDASAAVAPASNQEVDCYDVEQHIADAEVLLREVYGPHAKLVVQTLAQQHEKHHNRQGHSITDQSVMSRTGHETGVDVSRGDSSKDLVSESLYHYSKQSVTHTRKNNNHCYRVSAAFRQLGFPVELATTKGHKIQEVIEKCLTQALNSDLVFIQPSSHNHNVYSSRNNTYLPSKNSTQEPKGHPHSQGRQTRKHGGKRRHTMNPHQLELKAILDELRHLCLFFSRNLKFSIRPSLLTTAQSSPPQAASDQEEEDMESDNVTTADRWRCRAYVKNDWSAVNRTILALETISSLPSEAFSQCVAELRRRYKEEMNSDDVMLESVREVELLEPPGWCVDARCMQEVDRTGDTTDSKRVVVTSVHDTTAEISDERRVDDATSAEPDEGFDRFVHTYCAYVNMEDEYGNVTMTQTRRQPTQIQAYQNAALHAIRSRSLWGRRAHLLSESLSSTPLLVRMRWQFDAMVTAIADFTGKQPHEVAEIRVEGIGNSASNQSTQNNIVLLSSSELAVHNFSSASSPNLCFKTSFSCDGALVWESTSGGRYRIEFDAYVQALHYLLDQYGDLIATWTRKGTSDGLKYHFYEDSYSSDAGLLRMGDTSILFPSSTMLQLAVELHDRFNILKNHSGKWNCYALLGTLTSRLIGCYYKSSYSFNEETKEWWSTLTVDDGLRVDQILIQRSSKLKGESWRLACLAALRENFPRQYEEVIRRYPDVNLSGDTMARSSRFRALPREKRIQHIGNIFSLVTTFAEEDLGWTQLRIRLRNASGDIGLPQWIAEMEAQVEGEEGRRVVAVSPSYAQVRHARRALIYRVAKAYFPKELAVYQKLQRDDSQDPDADPTVRRTKIYQVGGPPFLWQLCTLLGSKHPSLEPITWQIRLRPRVQNSNVASEESTDSVGSQHNDVNTNDGRSLLHPPSNEEVGEWLSVLSEGSPLALLEILSSPDQLHQPLGAYLTYAADVFGANGDVLITEYHGGPSESAVNVLIAALKAASKQLGGADAEVLWTEYETLPCPSMNHPKELTLYLFYTFFGDSGAAWSSTDDTHPVTAWKSNGAIVKPDPDQSSGLQTESSSDNEQPTPMPATRGGDSCEATPAITNASTLAINTVQLGNYWVSTVCLRELGMLPIARAIAATKRGSVMDAITLAARLSFSRLLHEMAKRQPALSALATELLSDPIVENLPEVAVRNLLSQMDYQRYAGQLRLSPFKLLLRCMYRDYRRRKRIRAQQSQEAGGGSFQCRLYLQADTREVTKGGAQLVGFGSALSSGEALNLASLMALKNLFSEDATALLGTVGY